MTSIMSLRLKRLERHTSAGGPYAHLSDEELNALIAENTARIEAEVGMSASDYAVVLREFLDVGQPLPDGISNVHARIFISSLGHTVNTSGASCPAI